MTLEFLESEIALTLKPIPLLKIHRAHYLRMAEALMAAAMSVDDPLAAADWELGADLCVAQADKLARMVAQREHIELNYVRDKLINVRQVRRLLAGMAAKAAEVAA